MPPNPRETLAYLKAEHENAFHLGNNATPPAVDFWAKPLGGDVLVKRKPKKAATVAKDTTEGDLPTAAKDTTDGKAKSTGRKSGRGKSAARKAESETTSAKDAPKDAEGEDESATSDKKVQSDVEVECISDDDELSLPTPVYLSAVGKVLADGSRLSGAGTFFATPEDIETKGNKVWDLLLKARYNLQLGPPTELESDEANNIFAASVANAKILENMAPQAIGIIHKGFVKEDKFIRMGFKLFRDRDDDDDDEIDKITRGWDIGAQCSPGLQYAISKDQVINLPRMFGPKGTRIPHDKLSSVIGATVCVYFTLEHTHIRKSTASKRPEASFTATLQELHVIIPAHSVPTTPSKRLRGNEQMFGTPSPTKKKGFPSAGKSS